MGIGTSLRKKWMGGILDLWVSRCNMEQGLELCVHGSRIWREMWVTDSAEFWIGKARRSAFSVGVALLVRAPCGRRGVYTEVTPRFGEGVYSPAPRDKEEAYVALGMGGADRSRDWCISQAHHARQRSWRVYYHRAAWNCGIGVLIHQLQYAEQRRAVSTESELFSLDGNLVLTQHLFERLDELDVRNGPPGAGGFRARKRDATGRA